MKVIRTQDLSGAALRYVVLSTIMGVEKMDSAEYFLKYNDFRPDINWAVCGPLIEKHVSGLVGPVAGYREKWMASPSGSVKLVYGDTALIAACRAIILGLVGEEIQISKDIQYLLEHEV